MSLQNAEKLLDRTGWHILRMLQENARMTYAQIGKQVGLTAPGVADRIRRMEEAGILTGYRASIDLKLVGLGITAYLRIKASSRPRDALVCCLQDSAEVLEAHNVTGTDDFLIKIAVRDVDHLSEVIVRISEQPGVEETVTYIVMHTPVAHRSVDDSMLQRPA